MTFTRELNNHEHGAEQLTGNNAEACIRSAVGRGSRSRRAVSALRIQGIGLNRAQAGDYGDSIARFPAGEGVVGRAQWFDRWKAGLCAVAGARFKPSLGFLQACGHEILLAEQGIHGHPPRAVLTMLSHQVAPFRLGGFKTYQKPPARQSARGEFLCSGRPELPRGSRR
jgi:hypothetical protein